ncbi:hypothetical protein Pint_12548 [Pistacia integerrima]|uniref:Uncharacterized protein n=1 Tax=Pistacia integerrima TaxID=434235 RepID=A0ACC0Y731_9ROSI|nr:hypothetical protein Pint_12548 [Pistacia integerrima]
MACSVQWLVCWVLTETLSHSPLKLPPNTIASSLIAFLRQPAQQTVFREVMAEYPTADCLLLLDICYNFSDYTSIPVPDINFFFGDVEVRLDVTGVIYATRASQVCLPSASTDDESEVAIFGNV